MCSECRELQHCGITLSPSFQCCCQMANNFKECQLTSLYSRPTVGNYIRIVGHCLFCGCIIDIFSQFTAIRKCSTVVGNCWVYATSVVKYLPSFTCLAYSRNWWNSWQYVSAAAVDAAPTEAIASSSLAGSPSTVA